MDRNDREAIETLFEKIAEVERNSPPRDRQSEALIGEKIAGHTAAPYYMAQTIIVQEQALEAAERRIAELEAEGSRGRGGLFGGLFGDSGGAAEPRGSVPRVGHPAAETRHGGSGFLAGAAQTALGVTGGLLLGNAIAGMLGGGKAQAAEGQNAKDEASQNDQGAQAEEPELEEASFDDGGDFADFGDF